MIISMNTHLDCWSQPEWVFSYGGMMAEQVTQHVITKGGEFYSRNLGTFEVFNVHAHMGEITNIPPYNLIEADDDTYVAFDVIAKLWFTRTEVH